MESAFTGTSNALVFDSTERGLGFPPNTDHVSYGNEPKVNSGDLAVHLGLTTPGDHFWHELIKELSFGV